MSIILRTIRSIFAFNLILIILSLLSGCNGRITLFIVPESALLYVGDAQSFTVYAKRSDGSEYRLSDAVWTVSNEKGVLSADNGSDVLFTALVQGDCQLKAYTKDMKQSVAIDVIISEKPVLYSINIIPSYASLFEGEEAEFEAISYDQYGSPIEVPISWSLMGDIGSLSTVEGNHTKLTASKKGNGSIHAYSGSISGSVSIDVGYIPQLTNIAVSPDAWSLLEGEQKEFIATGYDQYGNNITISPIWNVTGGIGHLSSEYGSSVMFTATNFGEGTITASVGLVSTSIPIRVSYTPVLTSISINPAPVLIEEGQSFQFTATGYDQYGNTLQVTPSWSIVGDIGSVTPASGQTTVFTASKSGSGEITATYLDIHSSAAITVGYLPALRKITISPISATLFEGESVTLSASGVDQKGNPFSINPSWSNSDSKIGNINPVSGTSTTFTASRAGSCKIVAAQDSISGGIFINVKYVPIPTRVKINAQQGSQTIVGSSLRFSAYVFDQYDNKMQDRIVTWSISEDLGTLITDGNNVTFVATKAGWTELYARLGSLEYSVSVQVILDKPFPNYMNVLPVSFGFMEYGFEAIVKDQFGQPLEDCVVTWSLEPDGILCANPVHGFNTTVTIFQPIPYTFVLRVRATASNQYGEITDFYDIDAIYKSQLETTVVSPSSAIIPDGSSQMFTASCFDQYGFAYEYNTYWFYNYFYYIGAISNTNGPSTTFFAQKQGFGEITANGESVPIEVIPGPDSGVFLFEDNSAYSIPDNDLNGKVFSIHADGIPYNPIRKITSVIVEYSLSHPKPSQVKPKIIYYGEGSLNRTVDVIPSQPDPNIQTYRFSTTAFNPYSINNKCFFSFRVPDVISGSTGSITGVKFWVYWSK